MLRYDTTGSAIAVSPAPGSPSEEIFLDFSPLPKLLRSLKDKFTVRSWQSWRQSPFNKSRFSKTWLKFSLGRWSRFQRHRWTYGGVIVMLLVVWSTVLAQGSVQAQGLDRLLARGQAWRGASFPVENFQAYTSAFGYRQSATGGSNREFHYGLDLAAPNGSYIRSWWAGKVVELTDNTNCGTSVVIESGSWTHIYCHMQGQVEVRQSQRYLVDREGGIQLQEGQQIETGMRIGRVGMTGRTTGPHLHWALKHRGRWVDPGQVLRAMRSASGAS